MFAKELTLGSARLLSRNHRLGQLLLRRGIADLQYRCSYSIDRNRRRNADKSQSWVLRRNLNSHQGDGQRE
jgi:hypothetical protein